MKGDMIMSDMPYALLMFYLVYYIALYVIAIAFGIVVYILTGKGLSATARRRGINNPWLAWVPVGSDWMLGCISDQYRYVSYGEQTNRRSKLLWYNIAILVCLFITLILSGVLTIVGVSGASDETVISLGLLTLLPCFAMIPLAVLYSITLYKSYYDLFRSCDPGKSLVFLLISIFTGVTAPFFLYANRDKDLGMPPRKEPEQLP